MKKYHCLKSSKTTKIGLRTTGFIHYKVLADQDQQLYLHITGNDDDGYYSKEVIPFEAIEQVIKGLKPNSALSSGVFKSVFVGQSNNNATFLAAILRNEKLLAPMADAVRKHSVQPGWDTWKATMLKAVDTGKPYEPEPVIGIVLDDEPLDVEEVLEKKQRPKKS